MNQIGQKIIHLNSVDSTSNYVAKLLKSNDITPGTVIFANEQTHGRGQRGTNWQTKSGLNLTCSLYVSYNNIPIDKQEAIHHWISISVYDLLHDFGIQAKIKWPNDILTENKKIAGILIENTISTVHSNIRHSIIGIGLNVNQIVFDELNATSVKLEIGRSINIQELLMQLINKLNQNFNSLQSADFKPLKEKYLSNLWKLNKKVAFIRNEKIENGVVLGTNELGNLLLRINDEVEVIGIKEVKFIIP